MNNIFHSESSFNIKPSKKPHASQVHFAGHSSPFTGIKRSIFRWRSPSPKGKCELNGLRQAVKGRRFDSILTRPSNILALRLGNRKEDFASYRAFRSNVDRRKAQLKRLILFALHSMRTLISCKFKGVKLLAKEGMLVG
jgi:hypothetical protein